MDLFSTVLLVFAHKFGPVKSGPAPDSSLPVQCGHLPSAKTWC